MSFVKSVVKKDRFRGPEQRRGSLSSHLPQVTKKLNEIPTYAGCSKQQITRQAEGLMSQELLLEYFDLTAEQEEGEGEGEGAAEGPRQVDTLPVQLVLKHHQHKEPPESIESKLMEEYGPIHSYLVVGDLILEWDWTSLVIPHGKPIQEEVTGTPADLLDVDEAELEPVKVETLRNEVLSIATKYNKSNYYHVIRRSSHDFVCALLRILRWPTPPELQSKMKEYLRFLEDNRGKDIPDEFDSHIELDAFVALRRDDLSRIDTEYLILHYFMFHLVSRLKEGDPPNWKCEEKRCEMGELAATLNPKELHLNNFKMPRIKFRQRTSVDTSTLTLGSTHNI